jgi:hypothetical protein
LIPRSSTASARNLSRFSILLLSLLIVYIKKFEFVQINCPRDYCAGDGVR